MYKKKNAKKKLIFCFDIDNTICTTKKSNYTKSKPNKKIINLIRKKIGFKNILISDDLSMKSLKDDLKTNTIKTFSAGCNLALHCNGKLSEMKVVGDNSPKVSNFIIKKTSLFYKILS